MVRAPGGGNIIASGPDRGAWYAGRSLVVETTFSTADGDLVLTDALALGPDNDGHRLGVGAPHVLVRRLACTSGQD